MNTIMPISEMAKKQRLIARGSASQPRPRTPAIEILEGWHNDNHPGVFRFCDIEPCSLMRSHRP